MRYRLNGSVAAKLKNIQTKFINISTAFVLTVTSLSSAAPLFMTQKALAATIVTPVINEFSSFDSSDWVELYNPTDNSIDLNGWQLKDSSAFPVIDNINQTIAAHSYLVLDASNRLNKDGDTITLWHDNNHNTSVAYGDAASPDVAAPGDGQSAGRIPDDTGSWQILTTPTPGHANVANTTTPASNSSVTGQDFDTWDNSVNDFKGINVGFKTENFTHIDGITVTLQKGGSDIVSNTASPAMLQDINGSVTDDHFSQNGQLSAPFVVSGTLNDTYCQGGPCWDAGSHNWTASDQPDEATITVTGTDQSGNVTKYAYLTNFTEPNGVTFASLLPANQPPTITLIDPTPANNALVGDSFKVGFEADDDYGFKGIVVGLYDAAGGTYLRDCTMASNVALPHYTGTCTINTTGLDTGNYTIEGRVQDSDGVFGATAERTVFIDRTLPEVSFTSPTPANDSYLNGNFTVSFNAHDNYQLRNITVALYNTDGSLASSNFYSVSNVQVPDWTGTWNFDPSGLNDGTYILKLRAQDMAGNYAVDATRTIQLDRTAPIVTVTPLSANGTLHGTVNFAITVTGDHFDTSAMKSLWVYLYNVHDSTQQAGQNVDLSSGSGTFTVNTKDLPDGTYTLDVANFKDLAGNNANNDPHDQYFYDYTIDNTVNTPTNGAPDGVYLNTNDFDFTWDGVVDASGPVTYQFQSSLNPSQVNGVLTTSLWHSDTLPNAMIHSSGAPDGTWYWQVRALDTLGNTSDWSSIWTVTLDTKAPDAPTIKTPTPRQWFKTTPILDSWAPVTDPSGISHYQIAYSYDDGHSFGGSTCPGLTMAGYGFIGCRDVSGTSRNHQPASWEQGGVTIWVRAIDNAGNASAWSKPVHYYYDHSAPTNVDVTFPANGSIVKSTNGKLTVTGTATDNLFMNRVGVQIVKPGVSGQIAYMYANDNKMVYTNPGTWQATFDTNTLNLADGVYGINVYATDMAGNTTVKQITFTLDNTAPATDITTPTDGDTVSFVNNGTLQVTGTIQDTHPDHYWFMVYDPNGKELSGAELGTHHYTNPAGTDVFPFSYSWNLENLPSGKYEIVLSARDALGNKDNGSTKTIYVTVDNTAPTLTINSVASATSTPVTITGTTSDPTDTITVEVNGITYNATVTGTDWSATVTDPLTVGKYTATVTDSDTLGNAVSETADVAIIPVAKPGATGTSTGTGTGTNQTFTVTPANNPQVLGASTDTPNDTNKTKTDTDNSQVKGDQTSNSNSDKKTVNNSSAFLGLGWWWLLVLAFILGFLWVVLRKADTDDKKA